MRLIRDGENGRRGYGGWGDEDYIYLSLHCHHRNDFCIKVGSDESHFNVSLIVRDKVTSQCPQTTTFEEKGEPKQIRTEVPLLTSLTARPTPAHTEMCRQRFVSSIWPRPLHGTLAVTFPGVTHLYAKNCRLCSVLRTPLQAWPTCQYSVLIVHQCKDEP